LQDWCKSKATSKGNTTSASSLLATIFPANIIETNYKDFHLAYMAFVNNTMTVQDKETIRLLALGCPEANGGIVFNARAMHNNEPRAVYDVCQ
jgi:hypothetical protein